jgi:glutathione-regulated potassium-efflux system ancillary protein KefG
MPENRVLLLFAHPSLHKSRVNRHLIAAAEKVEGVTVRHLYELYPDFMIDVEAEQELLRQHAVIVLQHPLFWYSSPSLVKEWLDLVLQYGWAYGENGTALRGKTFMQAVTCGGSAEVYCRAGRHGHSVRDFLLPFEQSARLCGMRYLAPFVVFGAGSLASADDVRPHAESYVGILEGLRDGRIDLDSAEARTCLNTDLPAISGGKERA